MKCYFIDASKRSVSEIEYDGTIQALIDIYPYNGLCVDMHQVRNGSQDALIHLPQQMAAMGGGKFIKSDGAWGFKCDNCDDMHPLIGKAIIAGRTPSVDSEGKNEFVPKDPDMTLEEARKWVKWARVAEVSLEEAMHIIEEQELPARLRPDDESIDAKSVVAAELETHRILSRVH